VAIGKRGQNVRLASKLTGWSIDVKSESQYSHAMKAGYESLLAIAGMGASTADVLCEYGVYSAEDLLNTSVDELIQIKGIGETKAKALLEAAEEAVERMRLEESEAKEELAPETEGEELSPEAEGEELSPEAEGEELSPEAEGEELSPEADGEEFSPEAEGEELSPEAEGEELSPEAEGEELSPEAEDKESAMADGTEESVEDDSGTVDNTVASSTDN
jgi:N utilization substance protein A